MRVRRVVTGTTVTGDDTIVSDAEVEPIRVQTLGGDFYRVWGFDDPVQLPTDGAKPDYSVVFPPPGGFRFIMYTHPPASKDRVDHSDDAKAQTNDVLPGMTELMEHDGMHTSDSVDLIFVLSGEIWMTLGDGTETRLVAGDTIVQNGTRHAWENRSHEPCTFVSAIVGVAKRAAT